MGRGLPPLLLVGAGKMGGALYCGWCRNNLAPTVILDPHAPDGIARPGDTLAATAADIPAGFTPEAVILAIKPQMAAAALPPLIGKIPDSALVISILAGKTIDGLSALLGGNRRLVRAMPNTPAAIGQGITAAYAPANVGQVQRDLCEDLLRAAGDFVWLRAETEIDAVTAISGSGPAYVFLLAELLEEAAIELGLTPDIARRLARKTVSGAGALLDASAETAADLRRAVTSPKGTTEAALAVLMAHDAWPETLRRAVIAAESRARELAS
jgi:pyrroline-5-carboxylate reductase